MMIGLGVLFLFDRFNIIEFRDVIRLYWPVFLIIIGVSRLLNAGEGRVNGNGNA